MTSVRAAVELAEQLSHRGLVALRLEDVVRAEVGDGYTVRSIFADPLTDRLYLVVIHPDLPSMEPGAQAPILNAEARYAMQLRVLSAEDDPERTELWQRPVIVIGPRPTAQAPDEVMGTLWLEIAEATGLDTVLALLRTAAERPDAPRLATDFLDWLHRAVR